jgi:hypothetical protein
MEKKVGAVADSAYIPPHIRKRAAATNTVTNKHPAFVTNGSSIASVKSAVKSAVEQPNKLRSSP